MFKKLFTFLVFFSSELYAQEKKVCFTIDDLPVVNYGIGIQEADYQLKLTKNLLENLKQQNVPAIGFVNEMKLYRDGKMLDFQKQCLKMWLSYGMDLGNHTYAHKDFNTTAFDTYTSEILKGEKVTKALLQENGKQMEYFRHPYLHVGHIKERADSLQQFLDKHDYIVAPVTIDNDDYLFALAYHKLLARKDTLKAKTLAADYLAYMEQKLLYYEKQSDALFGRNISQILLIHANKLNSDYIGELAKIYQKNGYIFVTLKEALKDVAYQTNITKFGKYGISWIDRWALSAGKKNEFFNGDPITPPYVLELSKD